MRTLNGKTVISPASNDAAQPLSLSEPYIVEVEITGSSDILFHRWSCDDVAAKSSAAKGSAAKRSDNLDSYVYRNHAGEICLPGEYLRMSIIEAAKYRQDPRSPRKSARDLFKAGIVTLDDLCPIIPAGSKVPAREWDYLDRRRVTIQRNGVTRERPAFLKGWRCKVTLQVLTPEYIPTDALLDVIANAGRLVGVADFRPTFGRFQSTHFEVLK